MNPATVPVASLTTTIWAPGSADPRIKPPASTSDALDTPEYNRHATSGSNHTDTFIGTPLRRFKDSCTFAGSDRIRLTMRSSNSHATSTYTVRRLLFQRLKRQPFRLARCPRTLRADRRTLPSGL